VASIVVAYAAASPPQDTLEAIFAVVPRLLPRRNAEAIVFFVRPSHYPAISYSPGQALLFPPAVAGLIRRCPRGPGGIHVSLVRPGRSIFPGIGGQRTPAGQPFGAEKPRLRWLRG
jgi:hypothetical protein